MKDDEKDFSNDPKNELNKDHGFMKGDDLRKAAMETLTKKLGPSGNSKSNVDKP